MEDAPTAQQEEELASPPTEYALAENDTKVIVSGRYPTRQSAEAAMPEYGAVAAMHGLAIIELRGKSRVS